MRAEGTDLELELIVRNIFQNPKVGIDALDKNGNSERISPHVLLLHEMLEGQLFGDTFDPSPDGMSFSSIAKLGFLFDGVKYYFNRQYVLVPVEEQKLLLPLEESAYANNARGSPLPFLGLQPDGLPLLLILRLMDGQSVLKSLINRNGRAEDIEFPINKSVLEDVLKDYYRLILVRRDERQRQREIELEGFIGRNQTRDDLPTSKFRAASREPPSVPLSHFPFNKSIGENIQQSSDAKNGEELDWSNPQAIKAYLDQFVVGQDEAKKAISVTFSNYMLRVRTGDESLPRDNILAFGPSGVGKTYMLSLLAKQAGLPFLETKLSGKSTSGLVGENLGQIFTYLRQKVGSSDPAPSAVVFLDELDKLCVDTWKGVSGMGVGLQNELVGWLENADVGHNKGNHHYETVNTRNILFVTAGAFQGLRDVHDSLATIIAKRTGYKPQTGQAVIFNDPETANWFNNATRSDDFQLLAKATPEDLIKYGLIPELVGRLPVIAPFHSLTIEDKIRILNEAKDSPFKKYASVLSIRGYQVQVDAGVARIVAEACPPETGARALTTIAIKLFAELIYDPQKYSQGHTIKLTPELARQVLAA